jgi:hypothetical protein
MANVVWAILAVATVLVGVSLITGSPFRLIPSKCEIKAPFTCQEYWVNSNGMVRLGINNIGGPTLNVVKVTLQCNNDPPQVRTATLNTAVRTEKRINESLLLFDCGIFLDKQFNGDFSIQYVRDGDDIDHTVHGSLRAYVDS